MTLARSSQAGRWSSRASWQVCGAHARIVRHGRPAPAPRVARPGACRRAPRRRRAPASGTHPQLVELLEPHEQKKQQVISQADRVRQLQISNINALFECEKKQVEDENKAQLEFFRSRLIDTIEEKQKKASRQMGARANEAEAEAKAPAPGDKRKRNASTSVGPCQPRCALLLPNARTPHPLARVDLARLFASIAHRATSSRSAAGCVLAEARRAEGGH